MTGKMRITAAALLLSAGAAATAGAAWAQTGAAAAGGRHGHYAETKGTIASVSAGSLQLTTAAGTATIALTANTRVETIGKGTTADLVKGAHVNLHLVTGTTTADAVQVDLIAKGQTPRPAQTKTPRRTPSVTRTPRPTPSVTRTAPKHTRPAPSGTPGPNAFRGTRAEGQIAGVSGNTLTLTGFNGQSTSYTLAGNVAITKVSAGKVSDLAAGQTVEIEVNSSKAAVEVTILAS